MSDKKPDPNDIILGKSSKPVDSSRMHPLLSNEQVLKAQEKAKQRVEDERVKAALKDVEEQAYQEARLAAGFVAEGPAADIVQFTVNLPDPHINSCLGPINGAAIYWHGRTYPVPRHVANSLAEMQFRLWYQSAQQIHGQRLKDFYRVPHNTRLDGNNGEVVGGTMPTQSSGIH